MFLCSTKGRASIVKEAEAEVAGIGVAEVDGAEGRTRSGKR